MTHAKSLLGDILLPTVIVKKRNDVCVMSKWTNDRLNMVICCIV